VNLSTFIVAVFCVVGDRLKGQKPRQHAPKPKLSDAEVLTIEMVGEYLGKNTEKGLYTYFGRHYEG
jgi:hypothetical protein